ncbi:MAG: DMT family transporter [Desulfomicrobium escambiense]|nr:DMT family transporter [Desulfomicrobium escambiense]
MDLTGILTALLSALFMGTVGVFAKITNLSAEVITLFRLGLGAAFMLLFLLVTNQGKRILSRPSWPVLVNGAMLAGFIIFYVQAMSFTTMANAIMLVYLAPPVASIYAHFFLGERLNRISAALIALALFGFAMLMEFRLDFADDRRHIYGIGLGVVSMFCYAAFILINRIINPAIHAVHPHLLSTADRRPHHAAPLPVAMASTAPHNLAMVGRCRPDSRLPRHSLRSHCPEPSAGRNLWHLGLLRAHCRHRIWLDPL